MRRLTPHPQGKRPKAGRPSLGLYPEHSRTVLAQTLGTSVRNISRILLGQRKCPMTLGIHLARILSVSFDRLDIELRSAQDRFLAAGKAPAARGGAGR